MPPTFPGVLGFLEELAAPEARRALPAIEEAETDAHPSVRFLAGWARRRIEQGVEGAPPEPVVAVSDPLAGKPGEELELDLVGRLHGPIRGFRIELDVPDDAVATVDCLGAENAPEAPDLECERDSRSGRWVVRKRKSSGRAPSRTIEPGEEVLLAKAVLGIAPNALPRDHAIEVKRASLASAGGGSKLAAPTPPRLLRVVAGERPPPVSDLRCVQQEERIELSWRASAPYTEITVERDGEVIARLPGTALEYLDEPPDAPGTDGEGFAYRVVARDGDTTSLPAECGAALESGTFAPPVRDFGCVDQGNVVRLSWKNGGRYDRLRLLEGGELVTEIPGDAESYVDRTPRRGRSEYTLLPILAGFRSRPARCALGPPGYLSSTVGCSSVLRRRPR